MASVQPETRLVVTGERFHPEIRGNTAVEHLHRYIYALAYAEGKTILDIASGEGYGAALLASRAVSVIGVDIAEDAVAHARKKYKLDNLEFRQGSCSKIPLDDGVVDFVDTRLDPKAGTIRFRAVLPNADRLMISGLFVRVRMPLETPRKP